MMFIYYSFYLRTFAEVIVNKLIRDIVFVIIGSFIFSAGVNAFIISGNLGEGGVTGMAIILYYAFHIIAGSD